MIGFDTPPIPGLQKRGRKFRCRSADRVTPLGLGRPILEEPLKIQNGLARVPDRPGIGLTWRSEAVKALSLDR
jgi:hypothetical protein